LLFSDAIYGIRGTSGGTLLELLQDSTGWYSILEPVWSDFPNESDMWPEAAETLLVRWFDIPSARGRLVTRSDTFNSVNRLSVGDSLWVALACDSVSLVRWRGVDTDTIRMDRRTARGVPY
jgi:hypothetical protein